MQAAENHLLHFLDGRKQFVIPIYQRTYSWTRAECEQLWNDIVRAATDNEVNDHFIGSIVYVQQGILVIARTPQFLVIDGQQRLTTLTLLLMALARAARAAEADTSDSQTAPGVTYDEIHDTYLVNTHGRGEEHYKLLLTRADKEALISLIEERDISESSSQPILANYRYFEEQIRRSSLSIDTLYLGLQKLVIVDISLDRSHDNPQLIFESLNSTGLELSQADLIRNFVLMGLDVDEQTRLYNNHWYPMEQRLLVKTEGLPLFDRFMRDYLTVRSESGAIPNIRDVYTSFKAYRRRQSAQSMAEIAADLHRYSRYFTRLVFADSGDREIDAALADIIALKVDVAYPMLIEVYQDYESELLSRDDFLAILRLVESYVFRRAICGILTNSLNKTFATFMRDIDKSHYRESVEAAFARKDSYRRFPRDPEFIAAFTVKDVYNFRSRNYLLRKLENEGRREPITVEEYTIEHIMPQNENLSPIWRADLGPDWERIHSTYLHTIGNLTLTGYNSELSDRPFLDKRRIEGGFDDSPLRLNASVAHQERWGEDQIIQRAQLLAEKAAHIWAAPTLAPEALARYSRLGEAEGTRSYALNETNYGAFLQGDLLVLFEQLRKRILNLDSSVREEIKANYIAYKTSTNFVDIVPQRQRLRLTLNMRFDEIVDALGVCRDVTGMGHWGNGDVEVALDAIDDVDNIMFLIEQAFDKHREDAA